MHRVAASGTCRVGVGLEDLVKEGALGARVVVRDDAHLQAR